MKPISSLRSLIIGTSALAAATSLPAATLYWDGTSTTANADGGAGTWNTATNWDTTATAGTDVAWNNTTPDSAVFSGVGGVVSLGAARSTAGITFDIGGYTIQTNTLTVGSSGITNNSGAGSTNLITSAITIGASQVWTNNSSFALQHTTGSLVLGSNTLTFTSTAGGGITAAAITSGAGSIIVSANTSVGMSANNTYSGTTSIYGTLTVNSLTNFSSASGLGDKATNLASNLVIDGGILRVQVESGTSDRLFTIGAGGATLEAQLTGLNSGQIQLTGSTAINYIGVGNRTITIGGNSDDAGGSSIARVIEDVGGGNGTVALTKTGAHTWSVSGANTYSGGTTVSAGILTMGSAGALGSTSGQLTVNGGTLNMAAQNLTVGNLTGSGGIISGASGTRTLTIGQGNGTGGNFQGAIQNGAGGTTALTKTGTGTITLSGTNTYTGATNISLGTLSIGASGSINSTSGVIIGVAATAGTSEFNFNSATALTQAVTFAAGSTGGTLSGNGTINQAVSITAGNTLAIGNSIGQMNFVSTLSLSGTDVVEIDGAAGAGLLGGHDFANVTGALTYGGALTLDLGTIFGTGSYTLNLFDFASETGTFTSITLTDQYTGSLSDANLDGIWDLTSGNNTWQFTESTGVLGLNVIPEPSAALLSSLGLLALLRRRR